MFFKKKNQCFDYIDSILSSNDLSNIKSICFNLYEGENAFHLQIVGSKLTPEEDEDWACKEGFSTGENILIVDKKICGENWEEGLEYFKAQIKAYLDKGRFKTIFESMKTIGIGFVDGDLELIQNS